MTMAELRRSPVVEWQRSMSDTVNDVLDRAIASHGDEMFLDFAGKSLTYVQAGTRVARIAHLLTALGVTKGDTVVTVLDNNIDAVATFFGINRLGAICVPVNTAYRGEFLRHQIADAAASVVIAEADYAERIIEVADGIPQLAVLLYRTPETGLAPRSGPHAPVLRSFDDALATQPEVMPDSTVGPTDLSTLIYTAG